MKAPPLSPHRRADQSGVALVIILAFIVLLTGLVVAYFSRVTTDRLLSNSSFNQTKADQLARSASEIVITDLKKEIADGSTKTTVQGVDLYTPKAPANMIPMRSGNPGAPPFTAANPAPIPNLVRISSANALAPSPAIASRASAVNSTTNPSTNGRSISLARWNSHYFIPKYTPGTSLDSTPPSPLTAPYNPNPSIATGFTPPDWVFVTSQGPKVLNTPDTSVIGRYAYAIYDEGGLLDVNAAGYPQKMDVNAYRKANLAFADVKQTGLSDLQRDRMVGWRNYASAGLSSDPFASGFSLSQSEADSYYKFALTNPTGFLTANPVTTNNRTDQIFTSRQELIAYCITSGFTPDALQYFTTFSRALNQPSFAPDPNRPPTQGGTGGNDFGTGSLSSGATSDDEINPSFLTVRAAAGFKRFDPTTSNGLANPTVDNEPLVKKRFALNRLAWLTYKGPSANNMSDPVVQQTITALGGDPSNASDPVYLFVKQGTAQNIYNYFGLSWISDPVHSGASEWVYSHEGTAPVSSVPGAAAINKLSALTTLPTPREADFFELLRATIAMGSLGKAYTAETGASAGYTGMRIYATVRDKSVDAAIVQIGANIIDQFDSDGYPTRILFNNGLQGTYKEYRGIEDLPYINRIREARLRTEDAAPVTYTSLPATNQTLTTAGKCVLLQEPEIWNPHAWSGTDSNAATRPQYFRLIALTCNPSHASDVIADGDDNLASNIKLNVRWRPNLAAGSDWPTAPVNSNPAQPLTQDNSEMLFDIPANCTHLFREPTILMKPGVPGQSNLRVGPNTFVKTLAGADYFTSVDAAGGAYWGYPGGVTDNKQYIGIVPGGEMFPLSWQTTIKARYIDGTNPTNNSPGIVHAQQPFSISGDNITYRLQYLDPATSLSSPRWLTYDEKFSRLLVTSNNDDWRPSSNQQYPFKGASIGGYDMAINAFDPRTSRFTMHINGRNGRSGTSLMPPSLSSTAADAAQNITHSNRPDENAGYGLATTGAGIANQSFSCGASALGWYPAGSSPSKPMQPGMFGQNNPAARFSGGTLFAFADPDGVVRRAMGSYPPPTATQATMPPPSGAAPGQPLWKAYTASGGTTLGSTYTITSSGKDDSRPIVLNRPFRSVAEIGYTFSDTPWRNLNFDTPESGNSALLDVFCVNDAGDSKGMVAGRVNLNTRQAPVLQAILAAAYKNEFAPSAGIAATGNASADAIANGLVTRTSDVNASLGAGSGPLRNISELVGKWVGGGAAIPGATAPFDQDGALNYSGFAGVAATKIAPAQNPPNLSYILSQDASSAGYTFMVSQRFREATIRALASTGQTRVWNLMIDMVAQTGRYPQGQTDLAKFVVEGEQRYWVHVAIDRYTGRVIEKQIEVVKE